MFITIVNFCLLKYMNSYNITDKLKIFAGVLGEDLMLA